MKYLQFDIVKNSRGFYEAYEKGEFVVGGKTKKHVKERLNQINLFGFCD